MGHSVFPFRYRVVMILNDPVGNSVRLPDLREAVAEMEGWNGSHCSLQIVIA